MLQQLIAVSDSFGGRFFRGLYVVNMSIDLYICGLQVKEQNKNKY